MTSPTHANVLAALNSTLARGALDQRIVKMTEAAAQMVGRSFAGQFADGEGIGVAAHVYIEDGATRDINPGLIGVTNERIVLAWWTGKFRINYHTRSFPIAELTDVGEGRRRIHQIRGENDMLAFTGSDGVRYSLVFYSESLHKSVEGMTHLALLGAATFTFGDDTARTVEGVGGT